MLFHPWLVLLSFLLWIFCEMQKKSPMFWWGNKHMEVLTWTAVIFLWRGDQGISGRWGFQDVLIKQDAMKYFQYFLQ